MTLAPEAGRQAGEKLPAHSKAFDIGNDDNAVTINATLYLNISSIIDATPGTMGIVQAVMKSAVAAEASAQICEAITDAAGAGADIGASFATFDGGRYSPSVVVVPPSQLFDVNATTLAAAGISVVVDPAATATLIVDPAATVGFVRRMSAMADEPSNSGYGVAFAIFGKVSINTAGVAVVTAA